jgi:NitT/TauT family transport system substrate-binding protein
MEQLFFIKSRAPAPIRGVSTRRDSFRESRGLPRWRAAVMILGVVAASILMAPIAAVAADAVKFKLDFSPVGYQAPFYAGVSRGIYRKHGLAVDIIPGNGSYPAILELSAGKTDFAFADTSLLALAALQGGLRNVEVVAMVFEVTPYSVLYLKNRGITKPTDLAGKTEANFQGSGVGQLFRAFARINRIDISNVKEILSAPATYLNPLVVGQADFAPSTVNQFVNLQGPTAQAGNDLGEFRFIDYGIDMYGAALLANTDTVKNRSDVVRRFVQASLESIQWAAKHPEAAIDDMLKSNPQLDRQRALGEFRVILSVSIPRAKTATNPLELGWVDADKMDHTIDLVRDSYGLKQAIAPGELYTNKFVVKP